MAAPNPSSCLSDALQIARCNFETWISNARTSENLSENQATKVVEVFTKVLQAGAPSAIFELALKAFQKPVQLTEKNVQNILEAGRRALQDASDNSNRKRLPQEREVGREPPLKKMKTSDVAQDGTKAASVEDSSPLLPLPSVADLIGDYKSRTWEDNYQSRIGPMAGYLSRGATIEEQKESHEKERNLLHAFLQKYLAANKNFVDEINSKGVGVLQKVLVKSNDWVVVRGDLHSDLKTPIEMLEFFKKEGLLDKNYRCRNGVHIIFDGDYMDRGFNDIELFTLLLAFLMENPLSVHLIRGNHEFVDMNSPYSLELSWIKKRAKEFEDCYKTFPKLLCVAEQGGRTGDGQAREYVCISHAGVNPAVDLSELYDTDKQYLIIDSKTDAKLFADRIRAEADSSHPVSFSDQEKNLKRKAALEMLESHIPLSETTSDCYEWTDLMEKSGPSIRGVKGVFDLSPEDFHQYARVASRRSKTKHFIRAHTHGKGQRSVDCKPPYDFDVIKRARKVMVTTLPVARKGGMYGKHLGPESMQALCLKAAPLVKNWGGQCLLMEEGKPARFGLPFTSLYEHIF